MKTIILTSIIIIFNSFGAGPDLLFSIIRQSEMKNYKVSSSLVVLSDGSYNFKTNTGDWGRCTEKPAGNFKGKFTKKQLKLLTTHFSELKKECKESNHCFSKKPTKADWKVIGWGKNSGKFYYMEESANMPKLIKYVLTKDLNLWQNAIESLSLKAILKKNKIKINLAYKTEGSKITIMKSPDAFLWVSNDEQRLPAKSKPQAEEIGSSYTIQLEYDAPKDMKKEHLLIYAPTADALMPCAVIK